MGGPGIWNVRARVENKKQKTEGAQGPTASPLVPVERKSQQQQQQQAEVFPVAAQAVAGLPLRAAVGRDPLPNVSVLGTVNPRNDGVRPV